MKYLRQATTATVIVGPFVAISDAVTPVTNLTTSSTLNGRAVSNSTGAAFSPASLTHDANGHYLVPLATGDVPAVGRFRLEFADPTTYLPVWEDFTVLSGAMYDWWFGTAPPTLAAIATAGWTDTNPNDFNVPGSPGLALAQAGRLQGTGVVASASGTSACTVTFDVPYDGSTQTLTDGTLLLSFTSGPNHWKARLITGGTLTDSTHAALTFLEAFSQNISTGDTFAILSN